MKKLFSLLIILSCFWCLSSNIEAIEDPRDVENNKYGIHITNISDVEDAAKLVNSNGGEWGYVTLVIREDNLDVEEWQKFFDLLREKRLIPIVRLATYAEGDSWAKPNVEDVEKWVNFLDGLNWVVKNRYVVLFNEPNHAKEWGGELNPEEYVDIVTAFQTALKESSGDYFILPAGMDDAANDTLITMNAARYYQRMFQSDDQIFHMFDGWTSHSYPNPHFSGKPTDTGPGTVRGYESELRLVSQFGFDSNKPVFITETGWVHSRGITENSNYHSPEEAAEFIAYAFESVWNDENVVAVTPFILNYPNPPFDHFSWKDPQGEDYLAPFHTVRELEKTPGSPIQNHDYKYANSYLPSRLGDGASYRFKLKFTNTGQSIWSEETARVTATSSNPGVNIVVDSLPETKPGESASVWAAMEIGEQIDEDTQIDMQLLMNGIQVGEGAQELVIIEQDPGMVTRFKIWAQSVRYPEEFMIALTAPPVILKRKRPYEA